MKDQTQQVDAQSLIADARQLGDSLAKSLVASSFTDDEKVAWATVIPYLRIDQLAKLQELLEFGLDRKVERESDALRQVRKIMEEHAAKRAEIDQQFSQELANIAKELRVGV
ncbi:MAG: hypothetical protein UY72_C0003G0019 [Candidatus Uhrbacteria bacterium GW2011_GWD2_52_7]|uniref:Uncharacterized protein n=1 Tax=Candidatus Uhrbacteria bacterium GW2011_GWD2_52_7 TaxID=1618989 RepID=A0A0G1XIQ2_9BACT|nr:MAG: hypothetical protein UY72_C0003G0019 [Candidatus Uhrbacteria bacterium GW2011_GWD2_52_7]